MEHLQPGQVQAAARALADLADRPLAARIPVFDEVHRLLQDALAEVEGE